MSHPVLKIAPTTSLQSHPVRMTAAERAEAYSLVERPLIDLTRPDLTREDVLERIDEETLCSAPLNLLVSTAIAISAADSAVYTEDAVLRYVTALAERHTSDAAYLRMTAEKLVLADVEYQASISSYAAAETSTPLRSEWANPQHYLEACKVHERRMDRLLRARKEAFDRYEKASNVYRTALGKPAVLPASSVSTAARGDDEAAGTTVHVQNAQIVVR